MSKDAEHEEHEHIIGDEASWEEAVKELGDADHDDGGAAKRAAGTEEVEAGRPSAAGDASGEENGDGSAPHPPGEEGASETGDRADAGGEPWSAHAAGTADKTESREERNRAVQKRTKKSRKELLDELRDRDEAIELARDELEKTKQQLAIKEDKLIRMVAEFENYKKRTRREWELHQQRANAELIKDILGILDDFERAFEAPDDSGEHFRSGVQLIYSGLLDVMGRAGLKEIEAENRPFDPQYHEAMGELPSDDVEEGCVAQVVQKGYMLREQLLRPAKVIVARAREPEK